MLFEGRYVAVLCGFLLPCPRRCWLLFYTFSLWCCSLIFSLYLNMGFLDVKVKAISQQGRKGMCHADIEFYLTI